MTNEESSCVAFESGLHSHESRAIAVPHEDPHIGDCVVAIRIGFLRAVRRIFVRLEEYSSNCIAGSRMYDGPVREGESRHANLIRAFTDVFLG